MQPQPERAWGYRNKLFCEHGAVLNRAKMRARPQIPICRAANSFMISSAPPPIIITLTSR